MNAKTTLVLLLLLALLGGAAWFQKQAEDNSEMIERRLFEGLENRSVRAIRVDNLERGVQLRFEMDENHVWKITDPILYQADRPTLMNLLADVERARGLAVPSNERSETGLGFDPPRIVLEVDEVSSDGAVKTYALEIGAPDLDRNLMNVRVDGVYLRSLSRLYTTLNQDVDGFRSRRPLTINARGVVEVNRSGKVQYSINDEPVDTELIAIRDGNQWYSTAPVKTLLDSFSIGMMIGGAANTEITKFVEDECTDWEPYALDNPLCRIEFKVGNGRSEVLLLSRRGNSPPWFLTREGTSHVWTIDDLSALRLLSPAEGMADLRFMRALRKDVSSLKLKLGDRSLHMERGPDGWTVEQRTGPASAGIAMQADERRIEDTLARLEDLEFTVSEQLDVYGTGGVPPAFEVAGSISVVVGREQQGGEFGRVAGQEGFMFRRFGNDLPLIAPDWFAELAQAETEQYRSLQLTKLRENRVSALHLTRGSERVIFERGRKGIWRRAGESAEAVELLPVLDVMIYLKARELSSVSEALEDGIDVAFVGIDGGSTEFRVLRDAQGQSLAQFGQTLSYLKQADLFDSLAALLKGE